MGVGNFSASIAQNYLDDIFGSCNTTKLTLFDDVADPTEQFQKFQPHIDAAVIEELQHYVALHKLDIFGANRKYRQELQSKYNSLLKELVKS